MTTPSASERRFVNEILRAADRRAEEIVRANLAAIRYGIVDAIDAANRKATVQLPGPGSSSPGFVYPPRLDRLQVGARVRVILLPTGDRYIDEDLTYVASGTAFPANPVDGDRFFRTDRNIDYYYSGATFGWLTETLYQVPIPLIGSAAFTATGTVARMSTPDSSIWIASVTWGCLVLTTNSASHYWELRLDDESGTSVGGGTANTATSAPDAWTRIVHTINAAVTPSTIELRANLSGKVGTPGSFNVGGALLEYRLIG